MKNWFNRYWIYILTFLLIIETFVLNYKYNTLEIKYKELLNNSSELSKQAEVLSVKNDTLVKDIKIYEDVIDTLNSELLRCSHTCHEFIPINEQVED